MRVGFAAETQDLIEHATRQTGAQEPRPDRRQRRSADVFGADTNQVTLLWSDGRRGLPRMPKTEVAERVLDAVSALLAALRPRLSAG